MSLCVWKSSILLSDFLLKTGQCDRTIQKLEFKTKKHDWSMKESEHKMDTTIARYKNRNLTLTDCIDRYNRKIESVSEDRSIGPFSHLWLDRSLNKRRSWFFNFLGIPLMFYWIKNIFCGQCHHKLSHNVLAQYSATDSRHAFILVICRPFQRQNLAHSLWGTASVVEKTWWLVQCRLGLA